MDLTEKMSGHHWSDTNHQDQEFIRMRKAKVDIIPRVIEVLGAEYWHQCRDLNTNFRRLYSC